VPPVPNATEEVSVPVKVKVLLTDNVLALVTVNVPVLVVIANPLILVAVATPSAGVVSDGLVSNTTEPVPVEVVHIGAAPLVPVPVCVKTLIELEVFGLNNVVVSVLL